MPWCLQEEERCESETHENSKIQKLNIISWKIEWYSVILLDLNEVYLKDTILESYFKTVLCKRGIKNGKMEICL